jgi:hypothetical protein
MLTGPRWGSSGRGVAGAADDGFGAGVAATLSVEPLSQAPMVNPAIRTRATNVDRRPVAGRGPLLGNTAEIKS